MRRLIRVFSRRRRYDDISVSIQEHLEERIEELMELGLSRAQAEERARCQFGNVTLIAEHSREAWRWSALESLWADLKYALRQLQKSPGFTVTALVTLALAIGANSATFSLLNAILLRSLPVSDPGQLFILSWSSDGSGDLDITSSGYSGQEFSYPAFERFRDRQQVFSSLFGFASLGFRPGNLAITTNGQTTPATGAMVTGEYFSGLGVTPAVGRLLDAYDLLPSALPVAAISYGYWQRQFGGSLSAIGQIITVNGKPYTIIGVAARGFTGVQPGEPGDLWIPVVDDAAIRPWQSNPPPGEVMLSTHRWWWLTIMGRLRPGVTSKEAEAALDPQFAFESEETTHLTPPTSNRRHIQIGSARRGVQDSQKSYAQPSRILMVLVLLVLLAACANLATLLLARAGVRSGEIAVRLALGAGRWRVLRQLLTESVLLSLAGGALGILFALGAMRTLEAFFSTGNHPLSIDLTLDRMVLAFTAATSVLTGILFGIAPALRSTRVDVNSTLKDSASLGSSYAGSRFTLSKALVLTQAAISTFLLVGAGLFLHSLGRLRAQAIGFHPEHLLVFRLQPTQTGYKPEQLPALYQDVEFRMAALPGVRSATAIQNSLISGWINNFRVHIEGYVPPDAKDPNVLNNTVGRDFLRTTGIPLLAGRDFRDSDAQDSQKVAIINHAFATQFFSGQDPIGHHISFKTFSGQGVSYEIVGICGDAYYDSLRRPTRPTWYGSYQQYPDVSHLGSMNFAVQVDGNPAALAADVRTALRKLDSRLLITDLKTQSQQIDDSIVSDRMFAELSTFFGALALLLAAIGLYGTMSYSVARRTREFGTRMALGSPRSRLMRMVLSQAVALVLAGTMVGLACAILCGRVVASLLFGVRPQDGYSFVAAALLLITVAALAAWWPARRAAHVDPMQALRSE